MASLRKFDTLTPLVADIVERCMLQPSGGARLSAANVWHQLKNEIQKWENSAPTPPVTPTQTRESSVITPLYAPDQTQHSLSSSPSTSPNPTHTPYDQPPGAPPIRRRESRQTALPIHHPSDRFSGRRRSDWPTTPNIVSPTAERSGVETPPGVSSPRQNTHPSQLRLPQPPSEPYPHVSVDDVLEWKKGGKSTILPGRDEVLSTLRDREQVFVIDDSETMWKHRNEVRETAEALMYIVKATDRDGIELRFASRPEVAYKGTSRLGLKRATKHLVDKIHNHLKHFKAGACNMEHSLNTVIKEVVRHGSPTSITVFTDGIWQHGATGPGGGVEGTVQSLVRDMQQRGRWRTEVTIQFVRFGSDPLGIKRLRYLDDDLKNEPGMSGL